MHWTECARVLENALWSWTPALHLCSVWTHSPASSSCKAETTRLSREVTSALCICQIILKDSEILCAIPAQVQAFWLIVCTRA